MKIRFKDIDGQPREMDIDEGTDPRTAIAEHKASRLAKREELQKGYEAERTSAASESGVENFAAGMGRGAVDMGRSLKTMLGMKSEDSLREDRALDEDLLNTGAGAAGNIAGQVLTTALPGAGVGRAAQAAAQAARGGSTLARTMGALGRPGLGRTATEGAAVGALAADPDQRGAGAVTGAVAGSAAHGAGRVLKRAITGIAKPTAAASAQAAKGNFVPAHLAAEDGGLSGAVKLFYRDIIRAIPIAGGMIHKQVDEATASFRNQVAQRALPKGAQNVVAGAKDINTIMQNLDGYWQGAWKPFQGFKVNHNVINSTPIMRAVQGAGLNARQVRTIDGLMGSSDDLLRLRNEVLPSMNMPTTRLKSLQAAVDTVLKAAVPKKAAAQLDELTTAFDAYQDLQTAAAAAAKKGRGFKPSDLAGASASRVDTATAAKGGGALQRMGEEGRDAFGDDLSDPGFWQRQAVGGAATAGGGVMAPAAAGTAVGVGAGLATKGAQRAMMGQTEAQQMMADLIRQYPELLEHLGRAGRTAVSSGAAQ